MSELGRNQTIWIEALESGKYQQSMASLRNTTGFCCLGVACEISNLGKWEKLKNTCFSYTIDNKYRQKATLQLPEYVCKWLGLRTVGGVPNDKALETLTTLNDTGSSFNEIASIIRKNPEAYFFTKR